MKKGELGRTYKDGETICKEGESGDRMYVIQSGKVRVIKKTASGENTVAILESRDIFGEMALFDRAPRCATTKAEGEARVLSIDKNKLFATISHDPTLVFRIMEQMSNRLRRLNESLLQFRDNKLEMLNHISAEEICKLVMEEAKKMVPADNGSIMLYDPGKKALAIQAAYGPETDQKMRFATGEGIAGDVLASGKAELINNVSLDSRYLPGMAEIHSILCVPLRWDNQNFGVINQSHRSKKLFNIEDLERLDTLAGNASIAIQNAKIFSTYKKESEKVLSHACMLDMI